MLVDFPLDIVGTFMNVFEAAFGATVPFALGARLINLALIGA